MNIHNTRGINLMFTKTRISINMFLVYLHIKAPANHWLQGLLYVSYMQIFAKSSYQVLTFSVLPFLPL